MTSRNKGVPCSSAAQHGLELRMSSETLSQKDPLDLPTIGGAVLLLLFSAALLLPNHGWSWYIAIPVIFFSTTMIFRTWGVQDRPEEVRLPAAFAYGSLFAMMAVSATLGALTGFRLGNLGGSTIALWFAVMGGVLGLVLSGIYELLVLIIPISKASRGNKGAEKLFCLGYFAAVFVLVLGLIAATLL
jgi:hypothetical protein